MGVGFGTEVLERTCSSGISMGIPSGNMNKARKSPTSATTFKIPDSGKVLLGHFTRLVVSSSATQTPFQGRLGSKYVVVVVNRI